MLQPPSRVLWHQWFSLWSHIQLHRKIEEPTQLHVISIKQSLNIYDNIYIWIPDLAHPQRNTAWDQPTTHATTGRCVREGYTDSSRIIPWLDDQLHQREPPTNQPMGGSSQIHRLLLTGGLGKTLITPLSTCTRDAAPKRRLAPQHSTSHSVWSSWKYKFT
jgi:hypothetical protein